MIRKTLLGAVLALLAFPAVAQAASHRGVVVKVDRPSRLVAVANAQGRVSLVHTSARAVRPLKTGNRVTFGARALHNGTFAASSFRRAGRARSAQVRGLVLRSNRRSFVLSAHGAVLRISAGRRFMSADAAATPRVGSTVNVRVTPSATGLTSTGVSVVDPTADAGAIEGKIVSVSATELVVEDDGVSVTIAVPATVDVSTLKVGDEILATFTVGADGANTLVSVTPDENAAEADDEAEDVGDVEDGNQAVADDEDANDDDDSAVTTPAAGDDDNDAAEQDDDTDDDSTATSNSGTGSAGSGDDASDDDNGGSAGSSGSGGGDDGSDDGDHSGSGSGGGGDD